MRCESLLRSSEMTRSSYNYINQAIWHTLELGFVNPKLNQFLFHILSPQRSLSYARLADTCKNLNWFKLEIKYSTNPKNRVLKTNMKWKGLEEIWLWIGDREWNRASPRMRNTQVIARDHLQSPIRAEIITKPAKTSRKTWSAARFTKP